MSTGNYGADVDNGLDAEKQRQIREAAARIQEEAKARQDKAFAESQKARKQYGEDFRRQEDLKNPERQAELKEDRFLHQSSEKPTPANMQDVYISQNRHQPNTKTNFRPRWVNTASGAGRATKGVMTSAGFVAAGVAGSGYRELKKGRLTFNPNEQFGEVARNSRVGQRVSRELNKPRRIGYDSETGQRVDTNISSMVGNAAKAYGEFGFRALGGKRSKEVFHGTELVYEEKPVKAPRTSIEARELEDEYLSRGWEIDYTKPAGEGRILLRRPTGATRETKKIITKETIPGLREGQRFTKTRNEVRTIATPRWVYPEELSGLKKRGYERVKDQHGKIIGPSLTGNLDVKTGEIEKFDRPKYLVQNMNLYVPTKEETVETHQPGLIMERNKYTGAFVQRPFGGIKVAKVKNVPKVKVVRLKNGKIVKRVSKTVPYSGSQYPPRTGTIIPARKLGDGRKFISSVDLRYGNQIRKWVGTSGKPFSNSYMFGFGNGGLNPEARAAVFGVPRRQSQSRLLVPAQSQTIKVPEQIVKAGPAPPRDILEMFLGEPMMNTSQTRPAKPTKMRKRRGILSSFLGIEGDL